MLACCLVILGQVGVRQRGQQWSAQIVLRRRWRVDDGNGATNGNWIWHCCVCGEGSKPTHRIFGFWIGWDDGLDVGRRQQGGTAHSSMQKRRMLAFYCWLTNAGKIDVMKINVGIRTLRAEASWALAATHHLSRHFFDWKNCPTSVNFPI